MSTQIAVRLPEGQVAAVDALIASGAAKSRASFVERALARELQRIKDERDLAIILAARASGESLYPDLDGLAEWATSHPIDLSDED